MDSSFDFIWDPVKDKFNLEIEITTKYIQTLGGGPVLVVTNVMLETPAPVYFDLAPAVNATQH